MMPGKSGLDLTKEIKENNPIPIILLTAKGETQNRIEGLELGADDYLGKPFNPKELLLRIKNILSKVQKPILSDEIYIGNALVNLKKSDIKKVNFNSKFYICSNCLLIQKNIDKKFIKNINLIYKNYEGFNKFS